VPEIEIFGTKPHEISTILWGSFGIDGDDDYRLIFFHYMGRFLKKLLFLDIITA
jgi:hypothetical protein